MKLAIDGSNTRAGGGITHLCQLLGAARPERHGIERVVVWGGRELLERLPERGWLEKAHEAVLDAPLPRRLAWQRFQLPRLARRQCDLLFAPGGSAPHRFSPLVAMFQNLLPFDPPERARYGLSPMRMRLHLLRWSQGRTFQRADGVIVLSEHSRGVLERALPQVRRTCVIPHAVDDGFRVPPRPQRPVESASPSDPFRLLYVSIVDVYKHHAEVARAVARLRGEGLPVCIDFVGDAYPRAFRPLQALLRELDPDGRFLRYRGPARYEDLARWYREADAFVFASSCETFGIILLEAMAAGLPIASSERGPLPEILAGNGVLFDPYSEASIADALKPLVVDVALRRRLAEGAYRRALDFDWERCADRTFAFLRETWDAARAER